MKQHKWHKEIKAWADGVEIEYREDRFPEEEWLNAPDPYWDCDEYIFRIKPQPKETKYLYVYLDDNYELSTIPLSNEKWQYIGRIKLEDEE